MESGIQTKIIKTVAYNMARRQLLLLSSSRLHGYDFLQHAKDDISDLLTRNNIKRVLFIPYANAAGDYDGYTTKVQNVLSVLDVIVEGIHTFPSPVEAILQAESIFIGGGNTFLLLRTLIERKLIDPIRKRVIEDGIPYIGSSAGTLVATNSIQTTNDMPIVCPGSFDALKLVPFQINAHYVDPDPQATDCAETRDERISEFLMVNERSCLALREGTCLRIDGSNCVLVGAPGAKLFKKGKEPVEYKAGTDLAFLFNECYNN